MATDDKEASNTESAGSGAPIPEAFQSQVMELVDSCTSDEQLQFIHACVNKKQNEINKSEQEVGYSTDDEPKD